MGNCGVQGLQDLAAAPSRRDQAKKVCRGLGVRRTGAALTEVAIPLLVRGERKLVKVRPTAQGLRKVTHIRKTNPFRKRQRGRLPSTICCEAACGGAHYLGAIRPLCSLKRKIPFFLPSTWLARAESMTTAPLPDFWMRQVEKGFLRPGHIPIALYSDGVGGETDFSGFYVITVCDLRGGRDATRYPVVAMRKSVFTECTKNQGMGSAGAAVLGIIKH